MIDRMKKLLSLFVLVILASCIRAQDKGIENLPMYHIVNQDSVKMTSSNLKKNKPVMIIYFSPDCGHCQHLMYEMKPKLNKISNVQIVMITFTPYVMVKDFYKSFGLKAYPNITVGTEGYTYEMQQYFHVKTTPFIAIYNKSGHLVKAYEKVPDIDDLIAAAQKA